MPFTSAAQGPAESTKSHEELQLNLPSASISQQTQSKVFPKPKAIWGTKDISSQNIGMALDPADPSLLQNEYFFNEKNVFRI